MPINKRANISLCDHIMWSWHSIEVEWSNYWTFHTHLATRRLCSNETSLHSFRDMSAFCLSSDPIILSF